MIPATPYPTLTEALRTLGFTGALLLDGEVQREAAAASDRPSVDAQALGAADTLRRTPFGWMAEFDLARAITAALKERLYDARGARAIVLGGGTLATVASYALARAGVAHLAVVAPERPQAERSLAPLTIAAETVALATFESGALAMLERADLIVRCDVEAELPQGLFGPHLALVDLTEGELTRWRERGLKVGALTLGQRDIRAHHLQLTLSSLLETAIELEPLMELLHRDLSS
jgi:shikimate 5-dehydrogenase